MGEEADTRTIYITWKDGMWSSRDEFEYGQLVDLPEPQRDGEFLGWYTLRNGGERLDGPFHAERNVTFFAHWKGQTHTVTGYDPVSFYIVTARDQNGELLYETEVPHGASMQSIPSPQRDGYEFIGWLYGNGNPMDVNDKVLSDIELIANWELVKYPITWNTGGHGVLPAVPSEYTVRNRGYVPPDMDDLNEWKFMGWEPERIPEDAIGPITFTGTWESKWYYITIDPNGGTLPDGFEDEFQRTYNQPVCESELPQLEREGYDFLGWSCDGEEVTGDTLVVDDMDIVAEWRKKKFMVLKYPISDRSNESSFIYVDWGETIPSDFLSHVEREGYAFLGWYTQIVDGQPVDENTVVTSNLTIYGFWRGDVQHRITYDANGGTFDNLSVGYAADPETGIAEIDADSLPTPTRTGYVFEGWMLQNDGTDAIAEDEYQVSSDTRLYAKWREDLIPVQLHANGGILVRLPDSNEEEEEEDNG